MGIHLRSGLSYCETGDVIVFLDVDRDRYFCLKPDTERAFKRLVDGASLDSADMDQIDRMIGDGLLVRMSGSNRLTACRPPPSPEASLLDELDHVKPATVVGAFARLATSHLAVRMLPLRVIVGRLRKRKARSAEQSIATENAILAIAVAFRKVGSVVAPLDHCLPRSVAAAHALMSAGARPDFIIGVRLNPFTAHSWVQSERYVINESLDEVRNFTPILVL